MKAGTQKKDYALSHHIPRGLPPEEQAKADATAYLTRTGNADLLDVLGLIEPTAPTCAECGRRLKIEKTRPDGAPRCPSAICRERRRSLKA